MRTLAVSQKCVTLPQKIPKKASFDIVSRRPALSRQPAMAGWFEKFCAVTSAVRNARAEQGIPPKEKHHQSYDGQMLWKNGQ